MVLITQIYCRHCLIFFTLEKMSLWTTKNMLFSVIIWSDIKTFCEPIKEVQKDHQKMFHRSVKRNLLYGLIVMCFYYPIFYISVSYINYYCMYCNNVMSRLNLYPHSLFCYFLCYFHLFLKFTMCLSICLSVCHLSVFSIYLPF